MNLGDGVKAWVFMKYALQVAAQLSLLNRGYGSIFLARGSEKNFTAL